MMGWTMDWIAHRDLQPTDICGQKDANISPEPKIKSRMVLVSSGKASGSTSCLSWARAASVVIWSILMACRVNNKQFTTDAFVVQTIHPDSTASSALGSSPLLLLRRQTTKPLLLCSSPTKACTTLFRTSTRNPTTCGITTTTVLAATAGGDKPSGQKKKRRRKKPPAVPIKDPVKVSSPEPGEMDAIDDLLLDEDEPDSVLTKKDMALIGEVAKFEFQTDKELSMMGALLEDDPKTAATSSTSTSGVDSSAIPLPDIKEARKKKQMEEELARMEQEKEENKVKIKRSDKEAFARLLEQQPFADADDSLFEEEEYGTVSALLGERAKPFLSIPLGPLQVGHFIGALAIVLMAFIQYPGFPLTNLPTPLRECLQGGLGTVYAINTVLAVASAFKAPERGQPVPLWAMKTFSVGGLAYDQLMQLPTLQEIERAKNVKGKRALKNRKK